ncbi:glycoside hydrolase family 127 protein [Nakamurella silvestris]|nr:glycoside hydrolase family 127 protein [Nakamurella silvestris]
MSPDPTGGRPVVPGNGRLRPLGLAEVQITGGFWGRRQAVNAEATIGHIEHWIEREGWIGNFDAAREGRLLGERRGREFSDSEIYKLMEAMSWEIGRHPNADLELRLKALVDRVAPVQLQDGYLNTRFGRVGQGGRYTDLEWGHELYCYGHLIQAAVARARTHGDDLLISVARRAADHICDTFGPQGIQSVCGHAEVEMALVELARLTGEQRYLEQAALFVERRGTGVLADIEFGRSYFQDDIPFRQATVLRGHAVRAVYLASGAVDVAVETGDRELMDSAVLQWENTLARRTYLTGGMGSHHQDEAFGDDFVLPPDRAYSESCAGVGSVMLSWRLLLASGEARYADLIERTLFNVVATSPSFEGTSFYYTNSLHQRRPGLPARVDEASARAAASMRAPWFEVSCCPPNVARTFASLAGYLATSDDDGVQVHQYADSQVRTTLPDGRAIAFDTYTRYPEDGAITIRIVGDESRPWTLTLRVPSWAEGATLTESGLTRPVRAGTVSVTRTFGLGDEIRLRLPVTPRFTLPDPRIDAVRDCVAVESGPLVLCAESVDLPDGTELDQVRVDVSRSPVVGSGAVERPAALAGAIGSGGMQAHPVASVTARLIELDPDQVWPYESGTGAGLGDTTGEVPATEVAIPLIPYHAWANRGPAAMRVWLPRARPLSSQISGTASAAGPMGD